ncbi:MAG: 4Fe-4S dicluster domain-containing protein [Bacteroidales bacterium]|nr:4Fe-4S dicluster domain-containing protein [Bacteroidales bacterium]
MPCPYGIDIPGIFAFYNRTVQDGSYITSPEQKGYARARRRYLLSYNKAVPTVRQADHCISCNKCMSLCPQHIRIPQELSRIDNYIEQLKTDSLG